MELSIAAIQPAIQTAGGSVRTLRTPFMAGAPYMAIPHDTRTDEQVLALIRPIFDKILGSRTDCPLPPIETFLMVYRNAWLHHKGPRRKRYNPHLRAESWALSDVRRCCESWAGQRADATGAWKQHAEIADFPKRAVKKAIGDVVIPVPAPPVVAAPVVPAAPKETKKDENKPKVHWQTQQRLNREAAAREAAKVVAAPPAMSPTEKARLRAERILAAGGKAAVADA